MLSKSLIIGGLIAIAGAADATVLWNQPFDGTGKAYSSQNDPGGYGNFATVYDNFSISAPSNLTGFSWVGEVFNGGPPSGITAWTVTLYADAGGAPGGAITSWIFGGNGGETHLGTYGGYETFAYGESFSPDAVAPGTYWVSVVPDQIFPVQWAWSLGLGGDGKSFQDLFGARSQLSADFALAVYGDALAGVPEPATWTLMLMGVGGLGASLRARRKVMTA
jgi:hypothetical protein